MAKEKAYEETCAQLVLIKEGTYHLERPLTIACPISLHGAGQDRTILHGCGIAIRGTKTEKKRVNMQGMTMKGSSQCGLFGNNVVSPFCVKI